MPKTILLVEDDPSLRSCLADILSGEGGFTISTAADGTEALRLIDEGLSFDVLLTDRRMPLMGGEALITALRKRGLRQYMILMTGDVLVPGTLPGANLVVRKPMGVFDLIAHIQALPDAP
ncbi:MAG TPA: response regulator [Candidatus Binatia bacterium]|jgi:CheY-like chemotaxis protein|nr:response regulator [Candidatus Binatia bacterium]